MTSRDGPTAGQLEKRAARKARKKARAAAARLQPKRKSRPYQQAKPSKPKLSAASVVARLPQLTADETMNVWRNAMRIMQESPSPDDRQEARIVVESVETVWLVRARGAPDDWFKWPTTAAPEGSGALSPKAWLEEGMLKFLGYAVGLSGEAPAIRRAILTRAFEGVLPPVFPSTYLSEWGEPQTAARLHKMADSIASFARSAKRRDADRLGAAISDWEADLAYLHDTFYAGRFGFGWPRGNSP